MTEAEWHSCGDPTEMVRVAGRKDDRRLRRFACACCRLVWHLLTDPRSRDAVDTAELHAVGLVTDDELATAADRARDARRLMQERWRELTTGPSTAGPNRASMGAFGKDLAAHVAHTVATTGYYDGILGHVWSANRFEAF